MRFDKGLKVAALCAVTLASNLVLAAEGRVGHEAQGHQAMIVPTQPVDGAESVNERPYSIEQRVVSEPVLKQEATPVEKAVPPLELKGVRG